MVKASHDKHYVKGPLPSIKGGGDLRVIVIFKKKSQRESKNTEKRREGKRKEN